MARISRDFGKGIVALLLAGSASTAFAVPVKYTFTTDTTAYFTLSGGSVVPLPDNPLLASLSGHAVTGSFYYDADAPVSFTVPAGFPSIFPNNIGSTVHDAALTNLIGSINGTTFSDGIGSAHVGNETWNAPPNPPGDFLQLTGLTTDRVNDFVGDSVNGLALTNARLFWIEYQQFPAVPPDFVPGPGLLGVLPSFAGRVALDFTTVAGSTVTLFRDNLTVTRAPTAVSEPESLAMLLMGLAALAMARRRARATPCSLR
jgi:hypothetical protein